jgi:hypothetical protein
VQSGTRTSRLRRGLPRCIHAEYFPSRHQGAALARSARPSHQPVFLHRHSIEPAPRTLHLCRRRLPLCIQVAYFPGRHQRCSCGQPRCSPSTRASFFIERNVFDCGVDRFLLNSHPTGVKSVLGFGDISIPSGARPKDSTPTGWENSLLHCGILAASAAGFTSSTVRLGIATSRLLVRLGRCWS